MAGHFSACPAADMSSTWVGTAPAPVDTEMVTVTAQPDCGVEVTQIPVYTLNAVGAGALPPTVGTKPVRVRCPSCKGEVTTSLVTAPTYKTHLCGLSLYICCCWPFICLPYFINYCKSVQHYCPNCGCYIGSYSI
ncbi:lipopolysaccharide-induced tumor necrosis factor-alpha factor homolog [Drosophila santomea]|uniref:lipopolysaccharide-induced tumor necrosis factor-alpha factor homolog n=1 Tax=Drosophila santomea TaxID=129105 RepID=UPI001954A7F8|nr:lipopolysaccharide-induced tumor necrosis factor-alpha factor homolog [Drosophila santomea]